MLRFLVILLLIILVVRFFNRLMFSSYVYTNNSRRQNQHTSKEGSVTLESKPKTEKRISKDMGEYVDYEEVK